MSIHNKESVAMKENSSKRNASIDILRMIFTVLIILFHAKDLKGIENSLFKHVVASGGTLA